MNWIIYTYSAVTLWTIENVVDRHAVSQECRHPVVGMILKGVILFIGFTIFSLFVPGGVRPWSVPAFLALLIGFVGSGIDFAYYKSLRFGEISRVAPLFTSSTLFAFILAAVFLGERFHATAYLGIICVVIGGILVSLHRFRDTFAMDRPALFALTVGFLSAVYGLLIKLSTTDTDILNLLFWIGLGQCIVSVSVYAGSYKTINKKHADTYKHGVKLFLFSDILDTIALFLILLAYASGPLTLVAALEGTKPLLVLAASLGITILKPGYIRERFTRANIFKRVIAAILIVSGSLLIIFTS